ncbi:MAG: efflux RND transporter permease subunit [Bradymonadia bacterium]
MNASAPSGGPSEGGIVGWAVSRPVSITVGVILVILFGLLSVADLPIQLTPDISVPTLSVSTFWPGATPAELESDVIEPQEEVLKSLPGLVQMDSSSRSGSASITLELEVGADLEEALVRVNNLLSRVPAYPEGVDRPVISTANSTGPPLAVTVIQAEIRGGQVEAYRTWVEDVILPRLERIPGVASIRLIGGRETEVQVDFDPRALAARGLTVGGISTVIRGALRDVSAGDMPIGKRRYIVRTDVAPSDPRDLALLVVGTGPDGDPIRLEEVATVQLGLRKATAMGMVNGAPSMAMLFFREAGFNVLEVTREIRQEVDAINDELLAPEGLGMRIVSDQTGYIEGALDLVGQNLLLGGLLAVVVLLLFLRSIGASMVVALSIPVSIVGTALGMALLGRTLNIVSLAGMAFAVGMVVDNSIVVLESIDTWRQRTGSVRLAALKGTREVWGAILASTLTTAAVFLPIISWQDEVGELLRDVAVAISVSVFASLAVSVMVIPSFSARLLRQRKGATAEDLTAAPEDLQTAKGPSARVGRGVRGLVASPWRALVVAVIGLGGTGWLGLSLLPPLEYLPTGNRNVVFGVVIPPPGYDISEMNAIGEKIQHHLVQYVGVEVDGKPALDRTFYVGTPDSAFMGAVAQDPKRAGEVAALVREAQSQVPGVFAFANQASLFGRRLGGGRSIEVDLLSADIEGTITFGAGLFGALRGAVPGAQIRPIPGLDYGAPEFRVLPRRAEASRQGLSPAELALVVDAYVDGAFIGELGAEGEPKRDVVLRARGISMDDPAALKAAPVATPMGQVVPLHSLAAVEERLGPTVIQHIERRRALKFQISPPKDVALETALEQVQEAVDKALKAGGGPPDLQVEYAGSAGNLQAAQSRFTNVLLLAVIICFLLLAALFEDFLAPLAILVSVPLAGAGGVLALWAVNTWLGRQPLDMMTALGFVILIGVVVNNAILVVDGALARMRQGVPLADAIADAVRRRVRPIAMSALTSLAGLLPLVLFPGSGSELYRGVGAVVLGGLALSTLLTLFLVPAVFSLLWRVRGLGRLGAANPARP